MATQPVQPAEAPANTSVRRKRRLVIANDNGRPTPPAAPIALPPILAFITGVPMAPRQAVEQLIEQAIEALDLLDGDLDVELNGDEVDGINSEDDFWPHSNRQDTPGCPVSDPDLGADDEGEETNEDGEPELYVIWPEYGDDQSSGPINEAYAERIRIATQRADDWRYERRFA
ncbi:hypothetical protein [Rhizorhabdus wittichii]|nr:hypothetical protein [Rhizorhabdus wittichii]